MKRKLCFVVFGLCAFVLSGGVGLIATAWGQGKENKAAEVVEDLAIDNALDDLLKKKDDAKPVAAAPVAEVAKPAEEVAKPAEVAAPVAADNFWLKR